MTRAESPRRGIDAVAYRSQVVAGKNYLFEGVAGGKVARVKIFVPLPHVGQPPQVTETSQEPFEAQE